MNDVTKPNLSILLGSGFSMPEKLPSVAALNKRLSKIDESEIMIQSSQSAMFLNGIVDNNRHTHWDERLFLQKFLEFYNNDILKGKSNFHYEIFYDYYSNYLNYDENKEEIERFHKTFVEEFLRNTEYVTDAYNYIGAFNRTFNQLIAQQLRKSQYLNDISYGNYPPYDGLVNFLSIAMDSYNIKVHTLNHDLLFDFLGGKQTRLWQYYSDGYELKGSKYYGKLA